MSSVMDRLRKRRHFPVKLDEESTVYVRPMTQGEIWRMDAFNSDSRLMNGFCLACAVVDDAGQALCARNEGESDQDFAARGAEFFADIPTDTLSTLIEGIRDADKVPSVEKLAKN